ncbi:myotilin [Thalassophryne amazonica]|uniref:myotilin n=1 Tax=Thalassophryne amazonica TaxID=390379 RepID=UPI00147216AD|nr:myotilin [Thalassophryne amazonica]
MDLPTFSSSAFPPSAFTMSDQDISFSSQPAFQAPSYESSPHASVPCTTMRSTITLTPSNLSATIGLGSASLPANPGHHFQPASQLPIPLPTLPSSPVLPTESTSADLALNSLYQCLLHSLAPLFLPPLPSSPQTRPATTGFHLLWSHCLPATREHQALSQAHPEKGITARPSSSRSTDEDIQGSKDALIQDLEKKLRSKEARRKTGQKLSYEERMARRLLGPDSATYVFDQDNMSDSKPDQPDSPDGRHTGGLWGRHHTRTGERGSEGSAIQEKCYAPRFLQIPSDLTVEEGRFCRIDFKVGGLPTPDICWYLDGKAIRPDDYHKMLVCEKGLHSFIIEIVTVHHAGVYECVARNRAGESRFTMRLDVIAQEVLRPPTFYKRMLNSRALEGDTVRLECKVDASPPPQLYWKKDKEMLRIDPNRMSLYQDGSGRQCLLIEPVMKSDAGWYTLSAINEAGMSTCNARLDVGTRTTPAVKTAPPGSKALKLLSPTQTLERPAQHTAPLYESEEL